LECSFFELNFVIGSAQILGIWWEFWWHHQRIIKPFCNPFCNYANFAKKYFANIFAMSAALSQWGKGLNPAF
jgi:hypothetical protein